MILILYISSTLYFWPLSRYLSARQHPSMKHFFHIITSSRAQLNLAATFYSRHNFLSSPSSSEWLNDNNLKDQLISSLYQMFLPLSVKLICNSDHLRSPTFMLVCLSRLKPVQDQISNVVAMMIQTLQKTKLGQVKVIVSFHKKNLNNIGNWYERLWCWWW